MKDFTIVVYKPRSPPEWFKASILARMRQHRVTDIEQEEEHSLQTMLHWRDPVERLRTLRRRTHTLVDDDPASG